MSNLQLNRLAISYDNKFYISVEILGDGNFFTIRWSRVISFLVMNPKYSASIIQIKLSLYWKILIHLKGIKFVIISHTVYIISVDQLTIMLLILWEKNGKKASTFERIFVISSIVST